MTHLLCLMILTYLPYNNNFSYFVEIKEQFIIYNLLNKILWTIKDSSAHKTGRGFSVTDKTYCIIIHLYTLVSCEYLSFPCVVILFLMFNSGYGLSSIYNVQIRSRDLSNSTGCSLRLIINTSPYHLINILYYAYILLISSINIVLFCLHL